jgi:hypothetical protein
MEVFALAPLVTPDIIRLLVVIVVCGLCLYFVNAYVPMAPPFKTLLTVVVVLVIVLFLLRTFALI